MKRILSAFLCALLLCFALTVTAFADYDEIVSYDLVVTPNTEDGSLSITATLDWKALEALDYGTELKIGIPNGSIREEKALTDNIERLDYDNSYMYVYLDSGIRQNEVVHFSYSWVQEYMYTLSDNGGVSYDYTPGWFPDIRIDHMSVTWNDPAGVSGNVSASGSSGSWRQSGQSWQADDLSHGASLNVIADYPSWPTELSWENSADSYDDGGWDDWDDDYSDDSFDMFVGLVVFIFIIFLICMAIAAKRSRSSYVGGFGSAYVHPTYVYVGGLWYPAGPDHKPRPGSVGLAHKPPTPAPRPKSGSSSSSGGFGGGSRGGGFGSSGFGGGSRGCACASSCACACACACAGGGRAGCSAKNLYGAVRLNKELTKNLKH